MKREYSEFICIGQDGNDEGWWENKVGGANYTLGLMAYTLNFKTWEAEVGGSV